MASRTSTSSGNKKARRSASRRGTKRHKPLINKHILYEESVQSIEENIDVIQRMYKKRNKKLPRLLREDFCGTAALASAWVERNPLNESWGIDLDEATLKWGYEHHVKNLKRGQNRIRLIRDNVLNVTEPKVDVIAAFNFSYFVFKERAQLQEYFSTVHKSLKPEGIVVMDLFGGTGAMTTQLEDRWIEPSKRPSGESIPGFTYVWEHAEFDVVNHEILCHIHFKFKNGHQMKKAFTYDWRLWTIPEIRESLTDAGFSGVDVYIHGWTSDGESDEIFRRRTRYSNEEGWIAYIVGHA